MLELVILLLGFVVIVLVSAIYFYRLGDTDYDYEDGRHRHWDDFD